MRFTWDNEFRNRLPWRVSIIAQPCTKWLRAAIMAGMIRLRGMVCRPCGTRPETCSSRLKTSKGSWLPTWRATVSFCSVLVAHFFHSSWIFWRQWGLMNTKDMTAVKTTGRKVSMFPFLSVSLLLQMRITHRGSEDVFNPCSYFIRGGSNGNGEDGCRGTYFMNTVSVTKPSFLSCADTDAR